MIWYDDLKHIPLTFKRYKSYTNYFNRLVFPFLSLPLFFSNIIRLIAFTKFLRVSSMELMINSGSCRCGTVLNLRNERTGEILTAQQLRNKLEDIYQRYASNGFFLRIVADIQLSENDFNYLRNMIECVFRFRFHLLNVMNEWCIAIRSPSFNYSHIFFYQHFCTRRSLSIMIYDYSIACNSLNHNLIMLNIIRHKLVCEYDVNLSPLPLEYPENKNISIMKFKNIEGFHFENSEISENLITEYLNSMDSYDVNYENNNKKESDINLKLDRNVHSLREERVLTFVQREPFHLTAICSFCGFDEQIL